MSNRRPCDAPIIQKGTRDFAIRTELPECERAAAIAAAAAAAVACTRNETTDTCPHTTSVSAGMPERAASSGEDPRGREGEGKRAEGGERERRRERKRERERETARDGKLGGTTRGSSGTRGPRGGGRGARGVGVARGGGGAEPVRSGACTDDCGANSAERTTTGSRHAPSTSNLALFKNEDGAGLKADNSLIGRRLRRPVYLPYRGQSAILLRRIMFRDTAIGIGA